MTCREPGGTGLGERLREALLGASSGEPPDPRAELLVFASARAQLVAEVIRPALERGALVLCDRYLDSTVAYQHHGRGIERAEVDAVNAVATGGLLPDLTLLLDLPPFEGLRRVGRAGDYLESEPLDFHRRVRAGYLAEASASPGAGSYSTRPGLRRRSPRRRGRAFRRCPNREPRPAEFARNGWHTVHGLCIRVGRP